MMEAPAKKVTDPVCFRSAAPGYRRHAGAGIASFVMGIVTIILLALEVMMYTDLLDVPYEGDYVIAGLLAIAFLLCIFVTALMALAGTILGIIGVCQPDRKKVFAVLGLSIGGLILLMFAALVVLSFVCVRGVVSE